MGQLESEGIALERCALAISRMFSEKRQIAWCSILLIQVLSQGGSAGHGVRTVRIPELLHEPVPLI